MTFFFREMRTVQAALAFSIVSVTDIFDRVVTAARAVLTAVDRYFFIYFILI